MPHKRHRAEAMVATLGQVDLLTARGTTEAEAIR